MKTMAKEPDQPAVQVHVSAEGAQIENAMLAIAFDLSDGTYTGTDKSDDTDVFIDAWFRLGQGGWKEPSYSYRAESLGDVADKLGKGATLRVWYQPEAKYDPWRFLDVTVYQDKPFFVLGWGIENNKTYTVRARTAEVLLDGELFSNQKVNEPRVLRGGAGAEPNVVESTWEIKAHNSAMLTYRDALTDNRRRTIVAGGLAYAEFMRTIECHHKAKGPRRGNAPDPSPAKAANLTLTTHDPQGKRIAPGEMWKSNDSFFVDIVSADPFESLERYGDALAAVNDADPNVYDFPTLCGWMTAEKEYGDGTPTNSSPALVEQMKIAVDKGITKYTPVAVRLEPDYYCYGQEGDTPQGWWDDAHWAQYGALQEPYETFAKFAKEIQRMGGKVFTYFQGSMPSNDFALAHPEWMLNDDISRLYEDHAHARPFVRFDFTNPEFQAYVRQMWTRLGNDGVEGIKFDYPESAWASDGGFDDDTYTTVSAYRKLYELCREGMGKDAYLHERIMGVVTFADVPRTDCNAGVVDLQRVWDDASHFEPEMSSRMGLRWYKQGTVFRYYPDGKSFHRDGVELDVSHRRTFLTLIGLLSGRIELGTSFGKLTDEMIHDITRLYPILPNGKAFRPVDFLMGKTHPEVYVYDVSGDWKQVMLVNNDASTGKRWRPSIRSVAAPVSGNQADTGSLGLSADRQYHAFDFWNQTYMGILDGSGALSGDLWSGQALVYSVRTVADHPQVVGTNRHVMCGMMELSDHAWNSESKTLAFTADVIAGEPMCITIANPEGSDYKATDVTCDVAAVALEQSDHCIRVTATSEQSVTCEIVVSFD
jgi:hypothetical protein